MPISEQVPGVEPAAATVDKGASANPGPNSPAPPRVDVQSSNGQAEAPRASSDPGGARARAPEVGPASTNPAAARAPSDSDNATKSLEQRRQSFMISPRQAAGLAPMSADFVVQQLKDAPDIDVVRTIAPPRLLGLQSDGASGIGSIVVARMNFDKARQLRNQAGARLVVEHDAPLTFGLDTSFADAKVTNPGVLVPLGDGFQTTIEVLGDEGPLAEAEVYLFGSVWPTQGVTDRTGRVTLTIMGETPDTIRTLYVKPKSNYWGFWLSRPLVNPNGVNSVRVQRIGSFLHGFPEKQMFGWGQRAMGLDRLPPNYDGSGVKIAIINSGSAQPTHRNLHRFGPGVSVVAPNRNAWTMDSIGHGSHCGGIIAGGPVLPNGSGVRGFAPAAEIHVVQIFPGGQFSSLVQALDYCIENEIDVANLSLGGGEPSQIVEDRLIKAKEMGVACVVAAGNSGGPVQFPASSPHVLAVSAIGKWGEFPDDSFHATQAIEGFDSADGFFPAKFSCFGPEVDVCGPGVAIVSSIPADGFSAWDGTSMATPHVAGMAALVLAHHPDFQRAFQTRDSHRVERLFQIIKETTTPISFGDPARTGAGLPNILRALGLESQIGNAALPLGALPVSPEQAAMLSQILQAIMRSGGNGGVRTQAAGLDAQGASQFAEKSRRTPEEEFFQNAPVARGPAKTNGSAAGVSLQSANVGLGIRPSTPFQPMDFNALRSAIQHAGLLH